MTSAAITWDEGASDAAATIALRLSESGAIQDLDVEAALQWIEDDATSLIAARNKNSVYRSIGAVALNHLSLPIETFGEAAEHVAAIASRKHHDYGTGDILAHGHTGIAVRLADKVARIRNLQHKDAVNESLVDSWTDVVGYSIVGIMLDNDTFHLPLEADAEQQGWIYKDLQSATVQQVEAWLDNGGANSTWTTKIVLDEDAQLDVRMISGQVWVRVAS